MIRVFDIKQLFEFFIIPIILYLLFSCLFLIIEKFYALGLLIIIPALFLTFPIYSAFLFDKTGKYFISQFILWIVSISVLLLLIYVKNGNIGYAINILIYFVHACISSYLFTYALKDKNSEKSIRKIVARNYIATNVFFATVAATSHIMRIMFIMEIPIFIMAIVYTINFSISTTKQLNSAKKTVCIFALTALFFFITIGLYYLVIPYSIYSLYEVLKVFVYIPSFFCVIVIITSLITRKINNV